MSINKVIVMMLLTAFATCHQIMAGIPSTWNDNVYIFTFVVACACVAAILSYVKDN